MRAEIQRLLDGALRKIVRGVVAGNRGSVVRELGILQQIDLAGGAPSADSGCSSSERDHSGAVGALDERAGVCGDGPWGPLASFVRGGLPSTVGDIDRRARRDQV